ncbi:putative transposable element [Trichonephila clavipes]|nr:putative transposable element [Trichonephila clavipes]
MEKVKKSLLALQCTRNRPLRLRRRLDGLGRHLVGWPYLKPCLRNRTHQVDELLKSQDILRMRWLAIENTWDDIGSRCRVWSYFVGRFLAFERSRITPEYCETGMELSSYQICFMSAPMAQSCQGIYSQFGLTIHQNDHLASRRFVEWAQNEIAVVPDFHKRILFSDEAHCWLNGYVNKQNCRIWSEANPQVYVETPLHPEKLTVWCALWAAGIIGPYFFKTDEGHNVTVNGDRYRAMITNFFHS